MSGNASTAIESFNEIIAFLENIEDSESLDGIIVSIESQIATKQDKITDLETIRSGAAKGATALQSYTEQYTGTYSKPSGGIPKSDLASAVQTSLGKADTALQSYTETDPVFKASAAAVITSTNITSWNGKQDELVSGTNIKTVNGMSLLGSGNIAISTAYPVVEHTPLEETVTIAPNTYHVWDDVEVLNISFGEGASGVANEYVFQFTPTHATFPFSVPDSVVWVNGEVPMMYPPHTYVVSIVNNLAVWAEF